MRMPRIKIWQLMILIAAVALAIPWWKWHVEMLKRSNRFLALAASVDRFAAKSERSESSYRLWIAECEAQAATSQLDSKYLVRLREALQSARQSTASYKQFAAKCRRAATMPWLDVDASWLWDQEIY